MIETTETKQATPGDVFQQVPYLERLRDELEELETELNLLPGKILIASEFGDVAEMVKLEARQKELPRHIAAQKIQIQRAQIADLEARLPALQEARSAAAQAAQDAREKAQEAERVALEAQNAHSDAKAAQDNIKWQLRDLQRELTIAQASFSSGKIR